MKKLTRTRRAPVQYNKNTWLKVLDNVAHGMTLEAACNGRGLPTSRSLRRHAQDDPEFANALAAARKIGAGIMADEMVTEARELIRLGKAGKLKPGQTSSWKEGSAFLRWYLARTDPASWGGAVDAAPVQVTIVTSLQMGDDYVDPDAGYTIDVDPSEE